MYLLCTLHLEFIQDAADGGLVFQDATFWYISSVMCFFFLTQDLYKVLSIGGLVLEFIQDAANGGLVLQEAAIWYVTMSLFCTQHSESIIQDAID